MYLSLQQWQSEQTNIKEYADFNGGNLGRRRRWRKLAIGKLRNTSPCSCIVTVVSEFGLCDACFPSLSPMLLPRLIADMFIFISKDFS
jgi:hypothetical protein